ncbi:MAG: dihydropteroate synthase [Bacteroidota bacterium]|nr:dihydropteroate synthase [Bacteroidota bacterium]
MSDFKINSKNLDLSTTVVMGILNITDDSFYDGGKYISTERMLTKAGQMLSEGASIIDVGAQSSRPGSKPVNSQLEKERLVSSISSLKQQFPSIIISVDTYRAEIAKDCVEVGASIINDISAGNMDEKMLDIVSELNVPYIMMHMQGNPENMQNNPNYTDVNADVFSFFQEKTDFLKKKGFEKIIIDPGFGFGKTLTHNYELLNHLGALKNLGFPILVGLSRKSMISKLLENNPENALNGTTALNMIALQAGANILRVHDVKEAMECIKIVNFAKSCKK